MVHAYITDTGPVLPVEMVMERKINTHTHIHTHTRARASQCARGKSTRMSCFEKHTVLTNKCRLIQFGMVGGT